MIILLRISIKSSKMTLLLNPCISETDEIGKLALQCSKLLTENIQQVLTEFRDNQRETRRPYEDNVKKSIRNKKSSYDQLQRVRVITHNFVTFEGRSFFSV